MTTRTKTMSAIKTYSELVRMDSFFDRFEYLKLRGLVGEATFGGHRYLNQMLYESQDWKKARREAIIRDDGFDLAHEDRPINGNIYVHHINPITIDDIVKRHYCVFDLDNLICCSFQTHNAIHYGDDKKLRECELVVRKEFDTCPWR